MENVIKNLAAAYNEKHQQPLLNHWRNRSLTIGKIAANGGETRTAFELNFLG